MRYSFGFRFFIGYSVLLVVLGLTAFAQPKAFLFLSQFGAPMDSPMAYAMVPIMFFFCAGASLLLAYGWEAFSRLVDGFLYWHR